MRILSGKRKNERLQLQKNRGRQRLLGADVTAANVGWSIRSRGREKLGGLSIRANTGRARASAV